MCPAVAESQTADRQGWSQDVVDVCVCGGEGPGHDVVDVCVWGGRVQDRT